VLTPRLRFPSRLLPLLCILVLGASLRLLYVSAPLLDAHRWRQVDTAAIARNLYEVRFNVFYPQVDWGGRDGYVESEFPLMPAVTATLYTVFGPQEYLGRIVSIVFSLATIVVVYALARELLDTHAAGLAAAFLTAVSPAAAYYGRTFMPDSAMLFFWVSGVLGFVRHFRTGDRRALWLGSVATTFACLTKIPAVMMFAPLAAAAWHARRSAVMRDRAVMAALVLPLAASAIWYWHAYTLYQQTGLTFGILVQPAKTYPPTIAPGPWDSVFSKWSTIEQLTSAEFYLEFVVRLHHVFLLPWGLAGALLGVALWKRGSGRIVADLWLLALVAFVLVAGEGNRAHDYYQLPIVPAASLYFASVAAPIFASGPSAVARGVVLAIVAVVGFYYSGVVNSHFRPNTLDVRLAQAGAAAERVVSPDTLAVVVDDYGVTSPLLLYYMHRKGWSFDVNDLRPEVIEGLKRKGAGYFVTTVWSPIQERRPEAAAYLELHPRVALEGAPRDTIAFDLSQTR
jgi:4-amino-4-deoxy-L-arabinose transferase-like glycosyltransferase